jgi:hypothetical protein
MDLGIVLLVGMITLGGIFTKPNDRIDLFPQGGSLPSNDIQRSGKQKLLKRKVTRRSVQDAI